MVRLGVMALVCLGILAGCQAQRDRLSFDGQYFRSKLSKVDKQRDQFTVSVRPASASLTGAIEAGVHEATRYCVLTFGNSEIEWIAGPDQDPETLVSDKDTLVLRGACKG